MLACLENRSSFDRFSRQPEFKVSREDASSVMTLWSDLRILINYAKPEEQERALKLLLSTTIPFRDWAEVDAFYQYLVSEAVSECRGEILEIVLNGLSKSIATIKDADPSSLKHAKLPLSHLAWVEHRLVHEAAVRGDPEILHIVLDYGGDATSMDGFQRSTLHLLSVFSNNAESAGILLDHGAHSLLGHRTELDGMTAFMTAVANCNFAVADRLLCKTPNTERQTLLSSRPAGMAFAALSLFGHLIAWSTTVGEKPIEYLCSLPEIRDPGFAFYRRRDQQILRPYDGLRYKVRWRHTRHGTICLFSEEKDHQSAAAPTSQTAPYRQ